MKPHEYAYNTVLLKGKRLDFKTFCMHKETYDALKERTILLKCSRQVGKSVLEAVALKILAELIPYFNSLHVSPRQQQRSRFVKDKLNPVLLDSPISRNLLVANNEEYKEFRNGSKIFLSYAQDDPDRIRGISADAVMYDEVQDIIYDVIPVINECLAESPYAKKIYAGTPKSTDNTIEYLWQQSKQLEWSVKCEACGKTNVPLEGEFMEKMIGKNGPICGYCGKPIDPWQGFWLETNPNGRYKGFHIPRLMIKSVDENKRKLQWEELLYKYETYPKDKFYNEVLGVSVPVGAMPISRAELDAVMEDYDPVPTARPQYGIERLFMGIDWGITATNSFTVVTIAGMDRNGKFRVVFAKKYTSTNILSYIDEIIELFHKFGVALVGADFGAGATNNQILKQRLGEERVIEFFYTAQKEQVRVSKGKFLLDRTMAIDEILVLIKKKLIAFPSRIREVVYDFLSLREEMTKSGRKIYNHNPTEPDDFVHSLVFAYQAYKLDSTFSRPMLLDI